MEGGEGGREGERERRREGERERGREGERERRIKKGRGGEREGGEGGRVGEGGREKERGREGRGTPREGGREGGREGREEGRVGGRESGRWREKERGVSSLDSLPRKQQKGETSANIKHDVTTISSSWNSSLHCTLGTWHYQVTKLCTQTKMLQCS